MITLEHQEDVRCLLWERERGKDPSERFEYFIKKRIGRRKNQDVWTGKGEGGVS